MGSSEGDTQRNWETDRQRYSAHSQSLTDTVCWLLVGPAAVTASDVATTAVQRAAAAAAAAHEAVTKII